MERYCSTGQSPQRAVAPTEEEEEAHIFKRSIKIYIITAPTYFDVITSSGSALFELAKVTVVKRVN